MVCVQAVYLFNALIHKGLMPPPLLFELRLYQAETILFRSLLWVYGEGKGSIQHLFIILNVHSFSFPMYSPPPAHFLTVANVLPSNTW